MELIKKVRRGWVSLGRDPSARPEAPWALRCGQANSQQRITRGPVARLEPDEARSRKLSSQKIMRELHVIARGQSIRFRVVKYAILVPLFIVLYAWKGWEITWKVLVALAILGVLVHFFFRHMTDGWRKSWWLYSFLHSSEK